MEVEMASHGSSRATAEHAPTPAATAGAGGPAGGAGSGGGVGAGGGAGGSGSGGPPGTGPGGGAISTLPSKEPWDWKRCRRKPPPTDRFIYANAPDKNAEQGFVTNEISNTKFTPLTFIPKTLAEQFSRNMNRYFLLIACLQLISEITPVNPATTWVPLIVIFGITAVKELLDDLGRRKGDKAANSRVYRVIRSGRRTEVPSEQVNVGDVLLVRENEEIPCDLVVLSTSDPLGNCFIQTTNLDGESNLKVRSARPETKDFTNDAAIGRFQGVVKCGPPDAELYSFDSQLRMTPDSTRVLALSSDQLLLQATHLRNTEFVYGLAVYTGNETKFGKNKKTPPPKLTMSDRVIDRFSGYIFCFQLVLVFIFGLTGDLWKVNNGDDMWYLDYDEDEAWYQPLIIPARFLLLNSTMIPISLKVTLDICKLFYAKFIDNDTQLYDPVTNTPAHSNSTALSEDLGQIKYVLTDKTGTLTENIMVLKVATVGGRQFGHHDPNADNLLGSPAKAEPSGRASGGGILGDPVLPPVLLDEARRSVQGGCLDFFRNMALNNSVVPSVGEDGTRAYKASSPDEEALVKAAHSYKVSMLSREGNKVQISVLGQTETYEVLDELDFSSDRKRMSVVVRNLATNSLRLLIKGADDMVLSRLRAGQDTRQTAAQIDAYAESGLRTLVLAQRDLSESEYGAWKATLDKASAAMKQRQAKKELCYEALERDFELVGATAIEDKLQRGVPETIALLTRANIKFWMCTGDKFSTALTISQTCNLKAKENMLITVEGKEPTQVKQSVTRCLGEVRSHGFLSGTQVRTGAAKSTPQGFTVILEGKTLGPALVHCREDLSRLLLAAVSVVCCRVTPAQKALLVKLVKDAGFMTLAIGDGGNDVSMIQEAHVGVGIKGKEGLQASRAADYVVAPFMSLQRLLLVHGRYSYYRTSLVAQYSFYKSFLFCFLQIGFGFVSGFAGVSLFNSLCVAAYNALLAAPVIFFFLDKDIRESTALEHPEAYLTSQQGTLMTKMTMVWWFLRGLAQAIVMLSFGLSMARGSDSEPYESLGLLIFNAYLLSQDATMLLELRRITVYNVVSVFGIHLFAIIAGIAMNSVNFFGGFIDYYSFNVTLGDPVFWFGGFLILAAVILPVEAVKAYLLNYIPTPARLQRLHEASVLPPPRSTDTGDSYSALSRGSENAPPHETMNPYPHELDRRGSAVFYDNPSRTPRSSTASRSAASSRR